MCDGCLIDSVLPIRIGRTFLFFYLAQGYFVSC